MPHGLKIELVSVADNIERKKKCGKCAWNTTYRDKRSINQQDSGLRCSLPLPFCAYSPHNSHPPDRMPHQTTPSLPVKISVLRQLGIADNELPHGLARLRHNLLLFPSDTSSQESNICTNSGSSVDDYFFCWLPVLWERLYDTIAEGPIKHHGPDRDEDYYASKKKIFKSMSYLDQIAFVCLASGLRACQAPDCLRYRTKMERVIPVCQSWPGFRDWVLCLISCSLRALREVVPGKGNLEPNAFGLQLYRRTWHKTVPKEDKNSMCGLIDSGNTNPEIFRRCWAHLTTCILLTMTTIPGVAVELGWDSVGISGSETSEETGNESGSIDGPRPGQKIYSVEWMSVSSRRCPCRTPEFLTCRRDANLTLALHQCLGPIFICKHLILYKTEALQIYQLMLLRFSSSLHGFDTLHRTMEECMLKNLLGMMITSSLLLAKL